MLFKVSLALLEVATTVKLAILEIMEAASSIVASTLILLLANKSSNFWLKYLLGS
ncbi:Uncharacterised protein [Chlamydia abortus]|nr:Uncharacterised protein [Chlamydia abortus]